MSINPFLLYSLTSDKPNFGKAIIYGGTPSPFWTNSLIFSISCWIIGCMKAKEDNDCSSWVALWISRSTLFDSPCDGMSIFVEIEWSQEEILVWAPWSDDIELWSIWTTMCNIFFASYTGKFIDNMGFCSTETMTSMNFAPCLFTTKM